MTSRKACAQLVRGKRIRRGGGEGEGEGGKEDVIMTFSYVKMWWRFFNATLSWIYSVCVTSLILVYPCCYVLFQSEMHPWPDWILCWKITRLNEGIGLGYGVHEFLKNIFNLVFPSLSPPLFPPPSPFPSFIFSHPLLPPSLPQGLGTDEDTLTRVIVMRSEIDLVQVMEKYREEYNETLGQAIKVHWHSSPHFLVIPAQLIRFWDWLRQVPV